MRYAQQTLTRLMLFQDDDWHFVTEIEAAWHDTIDRKSALNRFFQWHKHTHDRPLEERVALGVRACVRDKIARMKHSGLVVDDGMPVGQRSYKITDKGKELLNGNSQG